MSISAAVLATALLSAQDDLPNRAVGRHMAISESGRSLRRQGIDCGVTDARHVGEASGGMVYEARCAEGPGYLVVVGGAAESATECLLVWAVTRDSPRGRPQCELRGNTNYFGAMRDRARNAGITCRIDDAAPIGRTRRGILYEVGCAGEDGYTIEGEGASAKVTPCLDTMLIGTAAGCRFTTLSEQLATVARWLPAEAPCRPVDVRFMGTGSAGRFHEVKCADGTGWVVRKGEADDRSAVPCSESGTLGVNCSL